MNDLATAERRGRLVPAGGARLWAEEIGPREAVAVLLVHRMAAQCFEWPDELLDGLLRAGYRVIVYDHRGFGWSEETFCVNLPSHRRARCATRACGQSRRAR